MINRKNTLLILGVFVLAGGIALGTGAFSSVEADRTVSVQTEGDSAALLGLQANGTYAGIDNSTGPSDNMEIKLTDINKNATTTFDKAVNVTNRGNQTVWITTNDTSDRGITFYNTSDGSSAALSDNSNAVAINSNSYQHIGLKVDTNNGNATDGNDITVTFTAENSDPAQ